VTFRFVVMVRVKNDGLSQESRDDLPQMLAEAMQRGLDRLPWVIDAGIEKES
jgi:hypothetical protein